MENNQNTVTREINIEPLADLLTMRTATDWYEELEKIISDINLTNLDEIFHAHEIDVSSFKSKTEYYHIIQKPVVRVFENNLLTLYMLRDAFKEMLDKERGEE